MRNIEVLILIVVEDGLVHVEEYIDDECTEVLILIVVEDGLVQPLKGMNPRIQNRS